MIRIENLTKVYPGGFAAVSDLTVEIPEGIFVLLGPNGSGKTTIMKILVGALRPTSGRVSIFGQGLKEVGREIRKHMGYQPESSNLYQDLTGQAFLEYMGRLGGLSATAARNKAKEMLGTVGLTGWKNSRIRTYSAGMRQKLVVVQSLMNDPSILLLDEPTRGLDPLAREEILEMIRVFGSHSKIVVLATHFLPEAEYVADRVAIIDRGTLLLEGSLGVLTRDGDLFSVYKDAFRGEDH